MKIGNIEIEGYAALAPMAGVADRAMREICRKFGAAYTVGELTSSKGVSLGDKKSGSYLVCHSAEKPMASQLFGSEPAVMAEAARVAVQYDPTFLDINMGCPAPKVAGNGGGSALLRDPVLVEKIVAAVVYAVDIPVTVKIRTGWDSSSINAVEIAKRAEAAGAAAITVHGRTRQQMYAPGIDYKTIYEVKRAVNIPVIANGDVRDGESAKYMYESTGADFVMVGRAAMGNPFVFEQINAYMEKGIVLPEPTIEQRLSVMKEHIDLMLQYKSERTALMESRKHTAWYIKGIRGAAKIRKMCGEIEKAEDIQRIAEMILAENRNV
ncbi:MAG: tRNA dihydrouridine synthase DusB [Clostridia bacterium]|nr:tRNA dihydrouridine synthase DusB [Oscillospiraceae bacterium]MBQ2746280.1 tRNA dihydrouridine synthase DusB [Clostridia bacterium]